MDLFFIYTEYFTLLGLYNCIFSSFPICFQSRKAIYGGIVEFLYQLEIFRLLYIGSNDDDALRVHLFHICIQFSPAWSNAKDGFIPSSLSSVKKKNKNWLLNYLKNVFPEALINFLLLDNKSSVSLHVFPPHLSFHLGAHHYSNTVSLNKPD